MNVAIIPDAALPERDDEYMVLDLTPPTRVRFLRKSRGDSLRRARELVGYHCRWP